MSEPLQQLLRELDNIGLAEKLEVYLILLHKWNQAYNLTAIRDVQMMVGRHIMDSLAVMPWLHGKRIIDVGTGAGLPGIPLALAQPDLEFVLLDSNGKKTRFLTEAKRVLSLDNVEVVQSRAEDYKPVVGFDTVVSRAFSSLADMLKWTTHLVGNEGIWLAMKGSCSPSELQEISYPYRIQSYQVAGVSGERCCIIIENI